MFGVSGTLRGMDAWGNTDDVLAGAVADWVRVGWRAESYGPGHVVMVIGRRANHVLHLLLSVVTAGLWLPVWLVVALSSRESRMVLTVGPDGSVPRPGRRSAVPGDSWASGRGLPIERR